MQLNENKNYYTAIILMTKKKIKLYKNSVKLTV